LFEGGPFLPRPFLPRTVFTWTFLPDLYRDRFYPDRLYQDPKQTLLIAPAIAETEPIVRHYLE